MMFESAMRSNTNASVRQGDNVDRQTWEWMNEVEEQELANEMALREIMTEQEYEEAV
jgi:hypothetical protein